MVNYASENKEWPIGLRGIGRIPVQTPLGPQAGFGTQPCYELRLAIGSNQESNAAMDNGIMRLLPQQWPKLALGKPSGS